MLVIDDSNIPRQSEGMEVVNFVGERRITHAIHDIDGTHSLIREWQPVMSACLHYAANNALDDKFDAEDKIRGVVAECGMRPLPETDRFAVESAGLSALTQMEWAVRRALQSGKAEIPGYKITEEDKRRNDMIIEGIWQGREVFEELKETPEISTYIAERVPRLFRMYEDVLNKVSRDANLADARRNPGKWQVPGSLAFLEHLRSHGIKNYFVTGAVVEKNPDTAPFGMLEEVLALGYEIGPGRLVEDIFGSEWNRKITKIEAMRQLMEALDVEPSDILIVGDGRAEISAAVEMGAVTVSRLDESAKRQREIHRDLGTNYIVSDYTVPYFKKLFF